MNFLYLCCGRGVRFATSSHLKKPRTLVYGRPIYAWSLDSVKASPHARAAVLWVVATDGLENEDLFREIRRMYAGDFADVRMCAIPYETRGASETVFLALSKVLAGDAESHFWALDNDVVYDSDTPWDTITMADSGVAVVVTETEKSRSDGAPSPYCHVVVSSDGRVVDLAEKRDVGPRIVLGAYGFRAGTFKRLFSGSIGGSSSAEWYMSTILQEAMRRGILPRAVEVSSAASYAIGTPAQIQHAVAAGKLAPKPLRWVFDVDQTLLTLPRVVGDYSTCEPIPDVVEFVRMLKRQGHAVILYTARHMKTCGGDAAEAERRIGDVTRASLLEHGIPYDALHFGKPEADVYVDDRATNPRAWKQPWVQGALGFGWDAFFPALSKSAVCRKVYRLGDGACEKHCSRQELEAFSNYVATCPKEIAERLPKVLAIDRESMVLTLGWLEGIQVGKMYVSGCLTRAVFDGVVGLLKVVHASGDALPKPDKALIMANYMDKLERRLEEHADLYSRFFETGFLEDAVLLLRAFFDAYEPLPSGCIHGDFWFHNLIWNHAEQKAYMTDVRGRLGPGDALHLGGDLFYDYAKMYQSIVGFGHWVSKAAPPSPEQVSLWTERFRDLLGLTPEALTAVRRIAFALMLGSVPFHVDELQGWSPREFGEWLASYWRSIG